MASDNIAGVSARGWKLVYLAPGMVMQWIMFMGVGNLRSYGKVRAQTRQARSPFMTWVYATVFWFGVVIVGVGGLVGTTAPVVMSTSTTNPRVPRDAGTSSLQAVRNRCVQMILEKGEMDRKGATTYCANYYK